MDSDPFAMLGFSYMNAHALIPVCSEIELVIRPDKKSKDSVKYTLIGIMGCGCGSVSSHRIASRNAVHYMMSEWLAAMIRDLRKELEGHANSCAQLKSFMADSFNDHGE